MKKKTTRTLFLVFSSLLLLVSATVSTYGQFPGQRPGRPGRPLTYRVSGTIRWRKAFGLVPMGPRNSKASVYPCSAFYVAALEPGSGKAVTYTDQVASPMQMSEDGDYYVCSYSLTVPPNRSLYMVPGMGGVLLLPKEDRSPMYITDAWIGGSNPKPPPGAERTFTGFKYVTLSGRRTRAFVSFELIYARPDNPR
jgi:hypothetical protein